jgi:hypothetical protein
MLSRRLSSPAATAPMPLAGGSGARVPPLPPLSALPMPRLTLPCALLAALALAAPASAAAAPPLVGLADQQAATFGDARLAALPIRHARIVVSWDAVRHGWQRREIDDWMRATKARGIAPLVTFGPPRKRTGRLPSVADYRRLTSAFRRRYPQVREYSPWNEPNISVRKAGNDPARVAAFYRALRAGCPSCKVLGADVVDSSTLDDWIRAYVRQFAGRPQPKYWGLHNYVDANSASSWGTRTMLRLTRGELWFTETGGVYRRGPGTTIPRTDRRHSIRAGANRAATAMRRVFNLAAISPRIRRVFVYHWRADRRGLWDSALLSARGTPRPAFDVFERELQRGADAASEG